MLKCSRWAAMLDGMQSASHSATAGSAPSGFAGFLAALTSPAQNKNQWNDEALADDVATISYESALKAHARWRPADEPRADSGLMPAPDAELPQSQPAIEPQDAVARLKSLDVAGGAGEPKSASITIRMSQAECAQLKRRAAEAGLTISAYMRSCTFEAEALRGQVKQALAELRGGMGTERKAESVAGQRTKIRWLSRIFERPARNAKAR